MRCPSMSDKAGVTGIVLAGGKSSRMGTDKAELLFRGVPLAQWQAAKLRSLGLSQVLISGYGPGMIPDDIPDKGPLGGLYTALRRAEGERCLVIPVDVPLLPLQTLEALLQAHRGGITILQNGEQPEPLIGVYDREIADQILPILHSGSTAVRRLLDQVGCRTAAYTGRPALLINCNTQADFADVCPK